MVSTQEQFEQVQAVKKSINTASEEVKNQALLAMADHLFCLLYTSPSPRDRSVSRMPSSA